MRRENRTRPPLSFSLFSQLGQSDESFKNSSLAEDGGLVVEEETSQEEGRTFVFMEEEWNLFLELIGLYQKNFSDLFCAKFEK